MRKYVQQFKDLHTSPAQLLARLGFKSVQPSKEHSECIKEHDNDPRASESRTPQSISIMYMAQDEMGCSNGNAN